MCVCVPYLQPCLDSLRIQFFFNPAKIIFICRISIIKRLHCAYFALQGFILVWFLWFHTLIILPKHHYLKFWLTGHWNRYGLTSMLVIKGTRRRPPTIKQHHQLGFPLWLFSSLFFLEWLDRASERGVRSRDPIASFDQSPLTDWLTD